MRSTASRLLDSPGSPPPGELDALANKLRGHLEILMPAVAARLDGGNAVEVTAPAAAVDQARVRMMPGGAAALGPHRHAQCLARSVRALCGHLDTPTTAAAPLDADPAQREASRAFMAHVRGCGDCRTQGVDCDEAAGLRATWREAKSQARAARTLLRP
ncbi:DUF6415 family natural product biosynthesis protein [Streptomyces niveus]|uniref:DUF6415 family natural product biosynthesis protein n=1 Tax=Streptomyces niveus TaxID=193462 RepID=UPI0036D22845